MSTQQQQNRLLNMANSVRNAWPKDVGIVNMEVYFPSQYVDQTELEAHDGIPAGKYTIGLGQTKMGFCDDREDIHSLCLTVLERLVKKTPNLTYADIGRLEVGTETLVDKSKSVKSVLMKLFEDSGNSDVEGVDSTNACYGGTAALFNCVSWVESSYWDGRYAVAVTGDIAIYASGNARPTGGAGAVAMLIGPNAPLVLDRGLRASHVEHAYDFYKPDMGSEYPTVDGKLSVQCYLNALDKCYGLYKHKAARLSNNGDMNGDSEALSKPCCPVSLDTFEALIFHSPFCKLVQKSFARLYYNDFLEASDIDKKEKYSSVSQFSSDEPWTALEKPFVGASKTDFESKTKPSLYLSTNVGNMYTSSLYGGLVSYLVNCRKTGKTNADLVDKRLGLFSYGSGLVSSFFSLVIKDDGSNLGLILDSVADVLPRMEARKKIAPSDFSAVMQHKEDTHHLAPFSPKGDVSNLTPGTWYLTGIDDMYRRNYEKAGHTANGASKA